MGDKLHFTKPLVESLDPAPAGRRTDHHDATLKGLIVQVTDRGSKTYYLYRRVHGKPTRVRIGRHPDISPAEARRLAEKEAGEIAKGANPNERKRTERAKAETLRATFDTLMAVRTYRPSTRRTYTNAIHHVFADWLNKPLNKITRDMVAQRHKRVGEDNGKAYADMAMRVLRSVLNFARARHENAQGESLLPPNPVARLSAERSWYKPKPREHYIREADLPAWFCTVRDYGEAPGFPTRTIAANLFELLLLTGLRVQEGLSLRWDDIDFSARTLTVRDPKNKKSLQLPFSDRIETLLKAQQAAAKAVWPDKDDEKETREWVFPSARGGRMTDPKKHLTAVRETFGEAFTHHDLRRTFAFFAARLVPEVARTRLLNHTPQTVTQRHYSPTDWTLLQESMQRITDFLMAKADAMPPSLQPVTKIGSDTQ